MPSEKPDFLKIIFFPLLCLSCVLSLIRFSMNIGFQPITALAAFLHRLYSYTSSRLYPCKTYQMGSSGLEPPTSRLSGARSNLLSYEPAARCRCQTRTFFGLVLKFSPGPLLLACLGFTNVASPSAFWILCVLPYFASVLVRSRRSVFPFHLRDGDDGIRTHDPLLAGQVLSQLSYTPMSVTHRPLYFCSFAFTMNKE